jgi:hypothetical protein
MSIDAHITKLRENHSKLEQEISRELNSPASSDEDIKRLKVKKLQIKDKLQSLSA